MDLQVISSIASNIVAAVGLIILNKWVLVVDKFHFTIVLSCLHYYTSFLACCILLCLGVFKYKAASKYDYIIRISVGSLASTIFMNLNLNYNSVSMYQISKLLCIPVTLIIETIFNQRKQLLTPFMVFSLCLIMFGVGLFIFKEESVIKHSFIGYISAALAIFSTSLAQVFFGQLQKALDFNPLQLLYHTSPLLTIGSFILIPFFEDRTQLMNTELNFQLVFNIALSCVGAVLLNLTNYFVLSQTTPLTYLVLGHIKTIIILIIGFALFEKSFPTLQMILGIIISLAGVVLYTIENNSQYSAKTNVKKISSPNSSAPPSPIKPKLVNTASDTHTDDDKA